MNEHIYYLSIQSTSLAHYLNKGLILPSRFYKKRPNDIQNIIQSDYLIFSKKKFLNDSNCSIEIILEDIEINKIVPTKDANIFLYPKPISISRIKKIYLTDEKQKQIAIDNINKGAAFIPEKLFDIVDKENYKVDSIDNTTNYRYSPELEEKIKTYNHVLGGLAFVRYTPEGEYFKNYFSILSHFNTYIQSKINNRYDKYDGAFTCQGDFWSKLCPLIYENISEDDVLNYSKQEKIDIKKSNGIFKYENINDKSITYKLAILNIYGEDSDKRKTTYDLIFDCKNEKIPKEKQEGIALIFGINNGYASFRNQYDKKIVKFKMESLLDYYTIESVFQYVINDKKDNERFNYIDKIFPNEELLLDTREKAFELEEFLSNIHKCYEKNILKISLEKLFNNIIDRFKNTFIEEMNKKDSELQDMKHKIENLKQEIETKENELQKQQDMISKLEDDKKELKKTIEDKDKNIDSLKREVKTNNELQIEISLRLCDKKANDLKRIAKEIGIKYTSKFKTIEEILTKKDLKTIEEILTKEDRRLL